MMLFDNVMDLIAGASVANGILKLRKRFRPVEIRPDLGKIFDNPRRAFKDSQDSPDASVRGTLGTERRGLPQPFGCAPHDAVAFAGGNGRLAGDIRRLSEWRAGIRSRRHFVSSRDAHLRQFRSLFGAARVGPLTAIRITGRHARLVGIEIRLDQPRRAGEPLQAAVVQFADRDAQPVDLGQRDLALRKRIGNPAGLREQPTRLATRPRIAVWIIAASSGDRQRNPAGVRCTSTQSGPSIAPSPSTTRPRPS